MKGNLGQKIKLIFFYAIYGLGIGGLVSMVFVFTKRIPDRFENIFPIILPIALVWIFYEILRNFNSIEIDDSKIIIKSILGKEKEFVRSDIEYRLEESGFTINYAKFAPILYIYILEKGEKKASRYPLGIYNEASIEDVYKRLEIEKEIITD